MPPRKPAAAKPAPRKAASRPKPSGSEWSQVNDAFAAAWRPLFSLLGRGVASVAVTVIVSLVVCSFVVFGLGNGCSGPVNPFVPAPSSVGAKADQLATQYGFTPQERSAAGGVFKMVAEQIHNRTHTTATSVDGTTRSSLEANFGPRWAPLGRRWLDELVQSWKGRFRPDSPAAEYELLWREIAAGLGVR